MKGKTQIASTEVPAFIGFRATPVDMVILKTLKEKLGIDWASMFRLAIRALAQKEGLSL